MWVLRDAIHAWTGTEVTVVKARCYKEFCCNPAIHDVQVLNRSGNPAMAPIPWGWCDQHYGAYAQWLGAIRSAATTPAEPSFACNCEHESHETPTEASHPYMALTPVAGSRRADMLGSVCADCAATCQAEYLLP